MDVVLIIFSMVALLLLQGFFSGSEIALVHADRLKLQHLANKGHRGAALVLKRLHKPEVMLGTTLVGTNLSVVTLTTLGTTLMIHFFGEHGDLYAFLFYTPLFLIIGEVVPKSVYQQKADTLGPIVIFPLQFFSWLFYPLVFVFSWVARKVAHLVGIEISSRELFTNREQIRTVIEMAEQGADIDVFDRDRIIRVTNFADTTVGEAMVPIGEMTTLSKDKSTSEAIHLARQHAHFRLPVYEDEHNQITGVVSFTMWDLMDPQLLTQPLSDFIKAACYVTHHELLDELLPVLQQRPDHMAVVVDEFGSAIGMITLEDILEQIVGDVMDVGYSFEGYLSRHKYSFEQLEDGTYMLDGRMPVTEASEKLKAALPPGLAHTIGGMVIAHLRHIPHEGESITLAGYSFYVEKVTERGIQQLHVQRVT